MEVKLRYQQTEVGVIPEDWNVRTLGQLGEFKNGINKGKTEFGHGFPFVNLLDVFGVIKVSNDSGFGLVNSSDTERKVYSLKKGDVLFVRSSVKPEGVGLTTLVAENLRDTVYSGFLIRFRDRGELAFEFKEHCFGQFGFRSRLIANSTISANTNINQNALKNLQIAFPPSKEEQRAIATALSDVDALLASLDRLIAKKRNIKQATMQQLLTGKTRLPGFSGKWKVMKLGGIGEIITGSTPPTGVKEFWNGNIPWVTPTDINSQKNIYTTEREITNIGLNAIRELPTNSVLVTCIASIGKNTILKKKGSCNQQINAIIPYDNHDADFIYYLMEISKNYLLSYAGITATNIISKKDFFEIVFSFPSKAEQTAIAAILSDMDAEIAALEQKRDKTRALKQGMMQELLTGKTRLV